jgi:hypothetical protein
MSGEQLCHGIEPFRASARGVSFHRILRDWTGEDMLRTPFSKLQVVIISSMTPRICDHFIAF